MLFTRPQRLHLNAPDACVNGPYFAPQPRQMSTNGPLTRRVAISDDRS